MGLEVLHIIFLYRNQNIVILNLEYIKDKKVLLEKLVIFF